MKRNILFLGFTFLISILLTSCSGQAQRLWLDAPGWSRAQFIGYTQVSDPVSIAVDDSQSAYLFFVDSQNDRRALRVVAYRQDGSLKWDRSYPEVDLRIIEEPRILWDGKKLILLWIDAHQLHYASLDPFGAWVDNPTLLTEGLMVENYSAAVDRAGLLGLWFASPIEEPGLYSISSVQTEPRITLIDEIGVKPKLIFDRSGTLHALWIHNPSERGPNNFVYGFYPNAESQEGESETLISPIVPGTTILDGPHLGLDDEHAYIFWSLTFFSGPEAGTVKARYVSVPKGEFSPVSTERLLTVPWGHNLDYKESKTTILNTGPRYQLDEGFRGGGSYVIHFNPNGKFADELAVSYQARLDYLMRNTQSQIAISYFESGLPSGYQLLSFTQTQSSTPFVISDDQGSLYVSWLERGVVPGWAIYFSSTSPGIHDTFSSLLEDDVTRLTAETLFGLFSGALLAPIALGWILPATIVLAILSRLIERRGLSGKLFPYLAIAAGILILWVVKGGVLQGLDEYVPFSAWIPFIPTHLHQAIIVGVPIAIFLIAVSAAQIAAGREETLPTLRYFFIYVIVDGLLTLAIYGVIIYAAF